MLREQFLPSYFAPYITDIEGEKGWKSYMPNEAIFLALRFFHGVNKRSDDKHQLIFPTPNTKARDVQITNTILGEIWTGYLDKSSTGELETERLRKMSLPGKLFLLSLITLRFR
jgi:hypothetical protein